MKKIKYYIRLGTHVFIALCIASLLLTGTVYGQNPGAKQGMKIGWGFKGHPRGRAVGWYKAKNPGHRHGPKGTIIINQHR